MPHPATLYLDRIDAAVFDTDGVITDTARVHAAAWKRTFDAFLERRADETGEPMDPFDIRTDYTEYVDGRSRLDGVRTFFASRGITVDEDQVSAVAEEKTEAFLKAIREDGVERFSSTVALLERLRSRGIRTAAVSASRNCAEVLRAAGVDDLFDVRVDGVDLATLGLPGKPEPALFEEAARRLEVRPARCAVVEDALAGVEAAHRGGFVVVVGIDRRGTVEEAMYDEGAHVVVSDLAEVRLVGNAA